LWQQNKSLGISWGVLGLEIGVTPQKNQLSSKVVKSKAKNNQIVSLNKVKSKSLIHIVELEES